MRSSHDSARGILRQKLLRFVHRVEVLGGDDGNGNHDRDAWMRRYRDMTAWASERCGPNGYATSSRSVEMKGGFRDIIIWHFPTAKDSNAFQVRFIDKWRG